MIDERFIILGVVLGFLGSLSYVVDTLKGRVRPNRVSWFMWALAPLIAFSAEIQQGVGLHALLTFSVGFSPLLVFIASFFNKKAQWKITKFDIWCGVLSLIGLSMWAFTRVGNIAIFFAILADGLAAIPTIIKSYKAPETESWMVFFLGFVSSGITLLAIKTWDFAHYGFPAYIFTITAIFVLLIKFKLGKRFR